MLMVSLRCGYSLVQNIILDVMRKAVTSSCRATAPQAEVFDTFGLDAEIENIIKGTDLFVEVKSRVCLGSVSVSMYLSLHEIVILFP